MSKDSAEKTENEVRGTLSIRTLAMPADTNPSGDIFGGWLLAQMDIAGGISAHARAGGRTATVGIEAMTFHRPVHVGDVICCYTDIIKTGNTSLTILVEVWVLRDQNINDRVKVTQGTFTYVAIDAEGNKRQLPPA
jgi:acyl-CoA thioesterase YciA